MTLKWRTKEEHCRCPRLENQGEPRCPHRGQLCSPMPTSSSTQWCVQHCQPVARGESTRNPKSMPHPARVGGTVVNARNSLDQRLTTPRTALAHGQQLAEWEIGSWWKLSVPGPRAQAESAGPCAGPQQEPTGALGPRHLPYEHAVQGAATACFCGRGRAAPPQACQPSLPPSPGAGNPVQSLHILLNVPPGWEV